MVQVFAVVSGGPPVRWMVAKGFPAGSETLRPLSGNTLSFAQKAP